MSHLRLARISLILAAIGLNAVPLLFGSAAHADTPPPAAKPAPDTVRPEIFKLIDPTVFKELMSAKKYPELAEKLKAAEAFPDKSPYETFIIERMRLPLASASGDAATAKKALQFLIDSGRLSDADRIDFIQAMGSYLYNERDYKNAITWFKRHQTESGDPSKTRSSLIRAYYLVDDNLSTKAELQLLFDSLEKQGKTPEQEDLRLFASAATKLKDNPGYLLAMEKLVTYYPSDDFWNGVLSRMQSKPSFNQRLRLDVYRLMSTAMTVMQAEDYVEMAELSLSAGFPTEAKNVIEAAYTASVLGTGSDAPKHKKLRDLATKATADDLKTIAAGEASAAKLKDGTGFVNLGFAYGSMGQYDKAIELMGKGIKVGNMKRPEDAMLRLGVVQAKAGRQADAIKTFQGIQGSDGVGDLARYWIIHLNRSSTAAPAPAAK